MWHVIKPSLDDPRFRGVTVLRSKTFVPLGSSGDEREVRLCTGELSLVLPEVREDGGGGRRAAPLLRKLQQRRDKAALRREGAEAPPAMVQGGGRCHGGAACREDPEEVLAVVTPPAADLEGEDGEPGAGSLSNSG